MKALSRTLLVPVHTTRALNINTIEDTLKRKVMSAFEPQAKQSEVLVIGAGPVGLVAALALHNMGRSVTIIEAEPEGRLRPGSRAIFVHHASLQILEQIRPGLGKKIAARGLVWPTKRTFWRNREVFIRHYSPPPPDKLPPFTSLPQVESERFLLDECQAAGIPIIWNTPISGVTTHSHCASAIVENGQHISADFIIGADGARSTVRRSSGISMEGSRSANSYVVVDVAEDPEAPLPLERTFFYEHPRVEGRNVLFVPFVGGWRVDLQCKSDDDPEEFSSQAGLRRWISKVMPPKYIERITWVSTYQFLQVVAQSFIDQNKRILLVGEAAHLFAPFGARGMNSGIADALAAAKAIDASLKTGEPSAYQVAVEDFAQVRKAAAEYNRDAAGQALVHIQSQQPLMVAKRRFAALLAPYWKPAGTWLDTGPYGPRSGPPGSGSSKY
jgi:3-(3-hydroxy-phenyl)propionate hydroxylase